MEVRRGYKQTELGLTPEDWEVKSTNEIGNPVRGGSPRPAGDARYFDGSYIPWLTVAALTNIPASQLVVSETATCLTEEGSLHSRTLTPGTLIIANSGATLGVAKILGIKCCANDGIAALLNLSKSVSPRYLAYFINTKTTYLREIVATGNGQPNLNTELIGNFRFVLPPTKVEQEAVADVLTDADALIESLEQVLVKKRQLKQGAMQELLTGRKCLPGFNEEWKQKRLGDTAILKARIGWQGLTTAEYLDSGDYYLVTGTEFKDGYIDWSHCHYVDESRYKQDRNIQLKQHDVLVTKDGTIGKVALATHLAGPATLNSGVFVIRPLEGAFHPEFFYHLLCSNAFTEFLSQLSAGSTINHLYQKDFVNFIYRTPATIREQVEIADVLSDMDAEVVALQAKLATIRALKQGMMQELLTGRIRLI